MKLFDVDKDALQYWRSLPPMRIDLASAQRLPEYSTTSPTGVTLGKRWRRENGAFDEGFKRRGGKPRWVICEYQEAPDEYKMTNFLLTPLGNVKSIQACDLTENLASRRLYTKIPMCKMVTYRPVVRVKMGRFEGQLWELQFAQVFS
jgi:hypothetical protein